MKRMGKRLGLAGVLLACAASSASAEMPKDRPFSMRGVELGITIDEFRQAAIPNDEGRYADMQAWCSNDVLPKGIRIDGSAEDQADGIVECEWFSLAGAAPCCSHHPKPRQRSLAPGEAVLASCLQRPAQ